MKPKSRSSPRKIERVCGQVGVARLRREKGPRLEPRGWRRSGRADEDRGLVALKADLLGEQRRDLGQFGRRPGSAGRVGSNYRRQPDQRVPRHKARRGAHGEDRWPVDRQHQFHYGICRQRQWASRLSRTQRCSADLLEKRQQCGTACPGSGSTRPSGYMAPMLSATNAGERADKIAMTPLRRIGKPIEVAYGVLFLASDEASFITGTELVIDGGFIAQ